MEEKTAPDVYNTGDVGYCSYAGHAIGIIRTWKSGIVVSVDCAHEFCLISEKCKLYQHAPVGFSNNAGT